MSEDYKYEKGFTLAETMLVLIVIGVIAIITIPALISKHIETANRSKIKKAMSAYDTAINKMVIENGIKNNAAFYEEANSFAPEGNCTNTAPYFNVLETLNNNVCTFKAPDGLYWNISNIEKPIVAFKEEFLTTESAEDPETNNAFYMIGRFDAVGILRVDDNIYEKKQNIESNVLAIEKLLNYLNLNGSSNETPIDKIINSYCNCTGDNCCSSNCAGKTCIQKEAECKNINVSNCVKRSHMPSITCSYTKSDDCNAYVVNEHKGDDDWQLQVGNNFVYAKYKGNNMTITCQKLGNGNLYCQKNTPGTGAAINGIEYGNDGKPIAYYNYDRGTCTKTSCSWNPSPFDKGVLYAGDFSGSTYKIYDENSISGVMYNLAMEELMNK